MRRMEIFFGIAAWVAVAILLPMSALEPVAARAAAADAPLAASLCSDGSPQLAMGCDSIHL